MVTIRENKHNKLGGLTSLFISFDYNEEIINLIKTLDVYDYDKKTHLWEVPVNNLSYLIDNLIYLDDIELFLKEECQEEKHKMTHETKTKLFEHQTQAVEYGLTNNRWLLLDAPGLGKSLSMIALAEELKLTQNIEHCLVICGINTLKSNWEKEIKKHSYLDSIIIGKKINSKGNIYYESVSKRAEQLRNKINEFFVIINIESLRDESIVDAISNSVNKFDMIILDEAHKCLEYDTLVSTNVGKLKIGDIVENNIECKVLSKSIDGTKEYCDIINKYKKNVDDFVEITVIDENSTKHIIRCTKDHKIFTYNRGYVCAKDLDENDELEVLN